MLKNDYIFKWNPFSQKALQQINDAISSNLVLATYVFTKDFIIYTNVIEEVISTILM